MTLQRLFCVKIVLNVMNIAKKILKNINLTEEDTNMVNKVTKEKEEEEKYVKV